MAQLGADRLRRRRADGGIAFGLAYCLLQLCNLVAAGACMGRGDAKAEGDTNNQRHGWWFHDDPPDVVVHGVNGSVSAGWPGFHPVEPRNRRSAEDRRKIGTIATISANSV